MSRSANRTENRGIAWLVGSFLFCPCHLPITLAVPSALLSGTAAAALVSDHAIPIGVIVTALWLAGTLRGVHHLRAARRSTTTCSRPEGC